MKTPTFPWPRLILFLLAFFCAGHRLRADVFSYSIFKVASYQQTSAAQPAGLDTPNAYYFGAQLFADTNNEVITNGSLTGPGASYYPLTEDTPGVFYTYNSPYFADIDSFDAAYPNGLWEFDVNDTNDFGQMTIPSDELYSTSIPYFTGTTWALMQTVDTTQPLTLTWNSFAVNPSASSAFIFVRIVDQVGYTNVLEADYIPADSTSLNVPASSLNAGATYQIQLLFSTRVDDVGIGFASGASATAGFDNLTYTTLTTLPPTPTIALDEDGANVILCWPVTEDPYQLEFIDQLGVGATWNPVTPAPDVFNNTNTVSLPVLPGQAQFFRLGPP